MEKTEKFLIFANSSLVNRSTKERTFKTDNKFNNISFEILNKIDEVNSIINVFSKEAAKRSLIDDTGSRIASSSERIRASIKAIKYNLNVLDAEFINFKRINRFERAHKTEIIKTLKRDFLQATKKFQLVVEKRTRALAKKQANQQKRFGNSSSINTFSSSFVKPTLRKRNKNKFQMSMLEEEDDKPQLNTVQQNFQVKSQTQRSYLHSKRALEAQQTERLVNELSQTFSKMATLVVEQGDLVTRIDDNIDQASLNIDNAQSELLKYYSTLSKERQLILKLLVTVLFIALFFVLFY